MLITGGRLGDIFGRKRLFMVGMAGFTPSTSRPWSTWTVPPTVVRPRAAAGRHPLHGHPGVLPHLLAVAQIGLGFSALHAGLTGAPFAVGSALASAASARLAPTLGRRILSAGSLLLVAGMVALMWTVDRYGGAVDSWQLLPALLLCGLGLGSVVAPLVNVVLAGIRAQDAGAASGVLTTVQQIGGAVGVAVIGVVFFGLLGSQAAGVANDVLGGLRAELQGAGLPPAATRQVAAGFRTCFEDRANAKDPSAVPASCAQSQSQGQDRVGRVVAATADTARRQNFSEAFQRTLLFEIAVFLACFLLVFLLPGARGDAPARHPGAAA
jgi:MFS family permease